MRIVTKTPVIPIPSTAKQEILVYDYLLKNRFINSFIAFNELHVTCLAAVIYNLKNKRGIPIGDAWVHSVDDDGEKKKWKNYWIEK